jgi:hypothetical protein
MRTLASTGSKSIPISELRQGWRIPLRFWIDHIRPMRSAASRNYEFTSSNGELDLHSPNGPFCRESLPYPYSGWRAVPLLLSQWKCVILLLVSQMIAIQDEAA